MKVYGVVALVEVKLKQKGIAQSKMISNIDTDISMVLFGRKKHFSSEPALARVPFGETIISDESKASPNSRP